jgi:hypothetical protein
MSTGPGTPPGHGLAGRGAASRSAPFVRVILARGRGIAANRDEDLGSQSDWADDEYLHSCAARDRARRRGRRSRNDLRCRLSRDPADAVGCKTWLHDLHTTEAEIRESAVELGAGEGNRTPDLRFTRPPLCLLSYTGTGSAIVADSVSRRAYRGGGRPRTERCRPRRPRSATPRSRSVSGRAGRIARRPPGTGPCLLSRRRARAGFR